MPEATISKKGKTLQEKVREADDESKTIYAMARELAERFGTTSKTAEVYLRAKRKGHKTHLEMVLKRKGFEKPIDYFNEIARSMGYASWGNYLAVRRILRENPDLVRVTDKGTSNAFQEEFENSLKFVPSSELDRLAYPQREFSAEEILDLRLALENLIGWKRDIVERIYLQGRTLEEISRIYNFSKEHVRQLEKRAIRIFRDLFGINEYKIKPHKRHVPYNEGELLLLHVLSKTPIKPRERADIVNQLWHNGEKVRSEKAVAVYQISQRVRKVSDKYLSR